MLSNNGNNGNSGGKPLAGFLACAVLTEINRIQYPSGIRFEGVDTAPCLSNSNSIVWDALKKLGFN